eukprot:SAG31_NODE_1401_length_8497_cov_4.386640_6_plen_91_part_00
MALAERCTHPWWLARAHSVSRAVLTTTTSGSANSIQLMLAALELVPAGEREVAGVLLRMVGKGCYFLVFVQLFEKCGTSIERNTALIEKV